MKKIEEIKNFLDNHDFRIKLNMDYMQTFSIGESGNLVHVDSYTPYLLPFEISLVNYKGRELATIRGWVIDMTTSTGTLDKNVLRRVYDIAQDELSKDFLELLSAYGITSTANDASFKEMYKLKNGIFAIVMEVPRCNYLSQEVGALKNMTLATIKSFSGINAEMLLAMNDSGRLEIYRE